MDGDCGSNTIENGVEHVEVIGERGSSDSEGSAPDFPSSSNCDPGINELSNTSPDVINVPKTLQTTNNNKSDGANEYGTNGISIFNEGVASSALSVLGSSIGVIGLLELGTTGVAVGLFGAFIITGAAFSIPALFLTSYSLVTAIAGNYDAKTQDKMELAYTPIRLGTFLMSSSAGNNEAKALSQANFVSGFTSFLDLRSIDLNKTGIRNNVENVLKTNEAYEGINTMSKEGEKIRLSDAPQ